MLGHHGGPVLRDRVHRGIGTAHPVFVEDVGNEHRPLCPGIDREMERLVLPQPQRLVERDAALAQETGPDGGAPVEGTRALLEQQVRGEGIVHGVARMELVLVPGSRKLPRKAIGPEGEHVDAIGLVFGEELDNALASPGLEEIVRIQKCDDGSGRDCHPRVACGRGTSVFLVDHLDAAVGIGQPAQHLERAVSRAVVHGDYLDVRLRLVEQRSHAGLDVILDVVHGHDDADLGHVTSAPACT